MPNGDVETYREGGQWKNRVIGSDTPTTRHATKAEAVADGRRLAQELSTEHIIKYIDGTIAAKHSYGNESRNVRG